MTEALTLRRAITAALARLNAGGNANISEARDLLAEALATAREITGLEVRGG